MDNLEELKRSSAVARISVACPRCGVGVGENCRSVSTPESKHLAFTHPARAKALFEADSTDQHQQALALAWQLLETRRAPSLGAALEEGARKYGIPGGEKQHRFEVWALQKLSRVFDTDNTVDFPA
jgi:hypothetical protein